MSFSFAYRADPSDHTEPPRIKKASVIWALILLGSLPTLGVVAGAFLDQGTLGSLLWAFAKVGLIVGPLLWWRFVQGQRIHKPRFQRKGLLAGFLTGLGQALIIIAAFYFIALPNMQFDSLQQMVANLGINQVSQYLALATYLTLVNALMEEYVFRWFFFTQFKQVVKPLMAVFLAACLFTLHHTVVLSVYLPWYFNVLASFGVFFGGLLWSYLYYRYGSIWPAYISHIGADIGVFVVGYLVLF
jgi:membrane protease YdiL (CAAX protease family)